MNPGRQTRRKLRFLERLIRRFQDSTMHGLTQRNHTTANGMLRSTFFAVIVHFVIIDFSGITLLASARENVTRCAIATECWSRKCP